MPKTQEYLYRIRQSSERHPSFNLERNGKNVGKLKFNNGHGSKASFDLNGETLYFSRQKGLRKDVDVHDHDGSSLIGSFYADLLSRGTLTMNGGRYRWAPLNKSQTTWAWYNDSGEEILRVHKKFHLLMENGEVYEFENSLSEDDRRVLSLLGWYLIVIGQQDILQHLFVSLEIYFKKRTNRSAQVG
jgi:hypothetical protein